MLRWIRGEHGRPISRWAPILGVLLLGLVLGVGLSTSGWLHAEGVGSPPAVMATLSAGQPPASFAGLVEKLSPAVVNIRITKVERTAGGGLGAMPFGDEEWPFGPLFRRFFQEAPRTYRLQGAGSGFIISPDGYIVTNNHVVEGATEVTVVLATKEEYRAKVVGRDPKTDLALLKITPRGKLQTAALGDSDKLLVGDWVVAIGNPFGLSHTVTAGIVSAKGRVIGQGPYDSFIQTDAAINPGNSGGPLFNLQGEVVGINTAIFTQTGGSVGIGFAVPINLAKSLLPQLEHGKVVRGYLGVNIQDVTSDLQAAMNLKSRDGALVANVVERGPAAQAGIERGDLITAFNGKPVADAGTLPSLVAATPPGTKVPVTVLRNGQPRSLTVTVGRQPEEKAEAGPAEQRRGQWGLHLQDLTPDRAREFGVREAHGVLVAGVESGSPADLAGVREGDVILEINRKPVASVQAVQAALAKMKPSDTLLLLLRRDEGSAYVALKAQ